MMQDLIRYFKRLFNDEVEEVDMSRDFMLESHVEFSKIIDDKKVEFELPPGSEIDLLLNSLFKSVKEIQNEDQIDPDKFNTFVCMAFNQYCSKYNINVYAQKYEQEDDTDEFH